MAARLCSPPRASVSRCCRRRCTRWAPRWRPGRRSGRGGRRLSGGRWVCVCSSRGLSHTRLSGVVCTCMAVVCTSARCCVWDPRIGVRACGRLVVTHRWCSRSGYGGHAAVSGAHESWVMADAVWTAMGLVCAEVRRAGGQNLPHSHHMALQHTSLDVIKPQTPPEPSQSRTHVSTASDSSGVLGTAVAVATKWWLRTLSRVALQQRQLFERKGPMCWVFATAAERALPCAGGRGLGHERREPTTRLTGRHRLTARMDTPLTSKAHMHVRVPTVLTAVQACVISSTVELPALTAVPLEYLCRRSCSS